MLSGSLFSNEFPNYIIQKLLYGVTQEGQKCIFMLCMEVAEEDMEVQEQNSLLR